MLKGFVRAQNEQLEVGESYDKIETKRPLVTSRLLIRLVMYAWKKRVWRVSHV